MGLTGTEISTIINRQGKIRCILIIHASHSYQIKYKYSNIKNGFDG